MVHHQISKPFTDIQSTLVQHWMSLPKRLHPHVPCKKDIQLPKLARIAPYLGMAEDAGPYKLWVRLLGSSVDESIGINMQQTNAFDVYHESARDWLQALFRGMWDQPMGTLHKLTYNHSKKPLYSLKVLHLPLCDEDGAVKFVVSTFERGETLIDFEAYEPNPIRTKDFNDVRSVDIGAGAVPPPQLSHAGGTLPNVALASYFD